MKQDRCIKWITFLLAATAGFCDTITFIVGGGIFSAHVTGNFILFAAQWIIDNQARDWTKLITFPVFVGSVVMGGWLASFRRNANFLLWIEVFLIGLAWLLAMLASFAFASHAACQLSIVFVLVIAMGIQNAMGKTFPKMTLSPTTVMTGNVTQLSLDMGAWLHQYLSKSTAIVKISVKWQMPALMGFLVGCIGAAAVSKPLGFAALFLPLLFLLVTKWLYTSKSKDITLVQHAQ